MQQRGNILFLILLAIILFVALSYAVNSGMRGNGKSAGSENAATAAAELQQWSTLLAQTVNRLMLVNNCKDTELSFLYDSDGDGTVETNGQDLYYNPAAPADKRCNVFDRAGGAMAMLDINRFYNFRNVDKDVQTNTYPSPGIYVAQFAAMKFEPVGVLEKSDLVFRIGYMSKAFCDQVENKYSTSFGSAPPDRVTYRFLGDYRDSTTNMAGGQRIYVQPDAGTSPMPLSGCHKDGSDGYWHVFYHILLVR